MKSKRALARDDARRFEEYVKQHNEEVAQREAAEDRDGAAAEEFAEGFLEKMRRSLGV